jgi:HPt (histidine-containing phosphotransfer) domain-containing protein
VAPSRADDLPPEARAAYEALRAKFRSGLAARWREIEEAADAAQRSSSLHRLAGAAGGYGFDEIGEAARSAELLAAAGPGPELDQALAALRRLVRDAEDA